MKSRFLEAIKEDDVKDMFKGQQIKIAYEGLRNIFNIKKWKF